MRIRKKTNIFYKNKKKNLSSFFIHCVYKGMMQGIKNYFSRKNVLLNDVVVNIIGHKGISDNEILYLITNEPVSRKLNGDGRKMVDRMVFFGSQDARL